jgi:hypothetical protein
MLHARIAKPTPEFEAGADQNDTLDALIADQRAQTSELDADAYTGELVPKCVALTNAEEQARRFLWRAADEHYDKMAAAEALLDSQANAIVQRNQAMGIDQSAPGGAMRAARFQARQQAEGVYGADVTKKLSAKAVDVADTFELAFVELGEAFNDAWSDWAGPSLLRESEDVSLEWLYRETALENEVMASAEPMADARRSLARLAKGDDKKTLSLFVRVARRVALKVRDMPFQKKRSAQAAAYVDTDAAMAEREQAVRLLRDLDTLKDAMRPASLLAAGNVLGVSKQFAGAVFGVVPSRGWPAEYEIRGSVVPAGLERPRPWNLDKTQWHARYLPGVRGALSLPGWSPKIYSGPNGGIARAPR